MSASVQACDVLVIGGGLVGASLVAGLRGSPWRVALVEQAMPPATPPRWDERCIALNHASRQILGDMVLDATSSVWEALAVESAPIRSTHISERGRFGVARFSADEIGLDALGHNVPLRALGARLWQAMQCAGGTLHCPARVQGVQRDADGWQVTLDDGRSLHARLLVAADGAQSPTRRLLGIDAREDDYAQSAIVTAVRTARTHRGCAYERFTPDGPIALLPKRDPAAPDDVTACSLVWTTPREQVDERMAWDDARFLIEAQTVFGGRLGALRALGARQAYPLNRVMSDTLSVPRAVFVGNAAQSLHPVAAQGFNLGLRDVATLAALLRELDSSGDPGGDALTADYVARRERDRRRVADFTDTLVRLFSNRLPGLRSLRHLGLLAVDLAPGLRDAVLWQNLGFGGGGFGGTLPTPA